MAYRVCVCVCVRKGVHVDQGYGACMPVPMGVFVSVCDWWDSNHNIVHGAPFTHIDTQACGFVYNYVSSCLIYEWYVNYQIISVPPDSKISVPTNHTHTGSHLCDNKMLPT